MKLHYSSVLSSAVVLALGLAVSTPALAETATPAAKPETPVAAPEAAGTPAEAEEAEVAVDEYALEIMRKMSDFLAAQKSFSIQAANSMDVVLEDGHKLQFDNVGEIQVLRPNQLKVSRKGATVEQEFYYNGKEAILFNKRLNFYATTAMPATLDETLDAMLAQGVNAPLADLIYSDVYKALMDNVETGYYVSRALVNGVVCDHLAFRAPEYDWQIWVEAGERPLPRKYLITSKLKDGSPQYTSYLNEWKLDMNAKAEDFSFTPPAEAQKIKFMPKPAASAKENPAAASPAEAKPSEAKPAETK
jgi:hypothetical protein